MTSEGRQAAAVAARRFIGEARPVPVALLVGVANLDLLTEQEYAEALRTRLGQIDQRLAAVEAAGRIQGEIPRAASEVLSYSVLLLRAEREWLAERVEEQDDREDRRQEGSRRLSGRAGGVQSR